MQEEYTRDNMLTNGRVCLHGVCAFSFLHGEHPVMKYLFSSRIDMQREVVQDPSHVRWYKITTDVFDSVIEKFDAARVLQRAIRAWLKRKRALHARKVAVALECCSSESSLLGLLPLDLFMAMIAS